MGSKADGSAGWAQVVETSNFIEFCESKYSISVMEIPGLLWSREIMIALFGGMWMAPGMPMNSSSPAAIDTRYSIVSLRLFSLIPFLW